MTDLLATAVAAAFLAMSAFPGLAAPGGGDPLAAFRWKARVLVVLAPDENDPDLAHQRAIFREMRAGADERDLALVEAVGTRPQAMALRQRFDLDEGFHAVLVGKDGGDKLTSATPLGAEQLFPLIDSMPMRQEETHKP